MLALQKDEVFYPESDGKPMAETDMHRNLLFHIVDQLQNAFPDAYVSGNICLYYEEGNAQKMISPDALLCRMQHPEEKRVYHAWKEGTQLDLVVELSSFSTRRMDHHRKKQIYATILKVPYYVIFDPHAQYLNVFILEAGKYYSVEANNDGYWLLDRLGIQLRLEETPRIRLYDLNGNKILTTAEREAQRAQRAEAKLAEQLEHSAKERRAFEVEIERLREQLGKG